MRLNAKRGIGILAIYAIALHAILWGVAPMAAGAPLDPFSVICHSEAATPGDETPAGAPSAPAHTCDHCTLCSAGPAPASLTAVFLNQLAPARLLQILQPISAALGGHLTTTTKLARGPPQFA